MIAARELKDSGWRVTVLEKKANVGGRMATRSVRDGLFDHGAQFFTVRSERFAALVEEWIEAGIAEEWSRGFAGPDGKFNPDGYPRYRGSEGMTSIPRYFARDLDVRTSVRVAEIDVKEGFWEARTETGARFTGEALILTAPVPQSLALAGSGSFELPANSRRQLEKISYDPCLALMARLDGPSNIPEPGGIQIKGEPLDWISDNFQKGISRAPGVTIHAGPEWSREHFEDDEDRITRSLLELAEGWLGSPVIETSLTRWRYSWVAISHPEPCLQATTSPPPIFCGDAFGNAKIEGAALSGLAAADKLLERA